VNQFPFQGYYWNGSGWASNDAITNGLTAYPNENDPTVGFNVIGDNTFDMIVAGDSWSSPPEPMNGTNFVGYSWHNSQWVVNPLLTNGLPNYAGNGGGDNFATLAHGLLGDGKWVLIIDNYDNNGYVGFEWDGNAWVQQNALVNGLPSAGSSGTNNQFPDPCVVSNFEGNTVLFVGLASGGGPIGSMECFRWTGNGWTSDEPLTFGVNNLLPWPNCPSVAFNVTGNGEWALLMGSASGFVNRTDYYRGYYWTGQSLVSITPLSTTVNATQSVTLTATITDSNAPYKYQWYVNDRLQTTVSSSSNVNTLTFVPTGNVTNYVYVKVVDSNGLTATSITATVNVVSGGGVSIAQFPGNSSIPNLFVFCESSVVNSSLNMDIRGNLTDYDMGLADSPILLSYSIDGGNSWANLTSMLTDQAGSFAYDWAVSVSGFYLLKAEYPGNSTYLPTSTIVNFETTPASPSQQLFSIQTNSTISAFSFNSAKDQLNFTVSGPPGSTGFVSMYIPQNMFNITNLQVTLDGNPLNYTTQSIGNSWLLTFYYHHSTHIVNINLGSAGSKPESSDFSAKEIPILIAVVAILVAFGGILIYIFQSKKKTQGKQ
jgi:hypothetical protein